MTTASKPIYKHTFYYINETIEPGKKVMSSGKTTMKWDEYITHFCTAISFFPMTTNQIIGWINGEPRKRTSNN